MCEIPGWNALEQSIYTLKNERQEGKTGHIWGWVPGEGARVNRQGEGGWRWWMYLV
jgi:hypothetical protein